MKPNSGIERGRGRERERGLFVAFSQMRASDDELKLFGIPEVTNDELAHDLTGGNNSGDEIVIGSLSHRGVVHQGAGGVTSSKGLVGNQKQGKMTGTIAAAASPYITMNGGANSHNGKVPSSRKLRLPVPTTSESVRRRKESLYPGLVYKQQSSIQNAAAKKGDAKNSNLGASVTTGTSA